MNLGNTFQLIRSQKGARQVGKYYARPTLAYGDVWCERCQAACDFDDSAAHNAADPGRSRLYIQASCHGEKVNILMTFKQWGDNEGKKIVAFYGDALPEKQAKAFIPPASPILTHPFLLMDRQG